MVEFTVVSYSLMMRGVMKISSSRLSSRTVLR